MVGSEVVRRFFLEPRVVASRLGAPHAEPPRLVWRSDTEAFLKGLCVVGDTVYFGLSPPQQRLARTAVNSSLVAVDLSTGKELYRRQLPTLGLLNLIAHPAYLATAASPTQIPVESKRGLLHRMASLGSVDVAELSKATVGMWTELWGGGHDFLHLFPGLSNYATTLFKGVINAKLVFSASPPAVRRQFYEGKGLPPSVLEERPWPRSNTWRVVFPAWRALRQHILPILDEVFMHRLGIPDYERRLLRVQMNRMPAGSNIGPHADQGYYASHAHRYHIPLIVPKCVRFQHRSARSGAGSSGSLDDSSWDELPFKEGEVFEVNNLIAHRVAQTGPYERVTLILDLLDEPVDATVEIRATCKSWFDSDCYTDGNVSHSEFRGGL